MGKYTIQPYNLFFLSAVKDLSKFYFYTNTTNVRYLSNSSISIKTIIIVLGNISVD